jgi:hypothetical protein
MLTCTGIAESVDLARVTRPALVSRPAFQVGIREAMASMSGCSSVRRSRLSDRGIPKYLHGNGDRTHGNACCAVVTAASSQRMGVARTSLDWRQCSLCLTRCLLV